MHMIEGRKSRLRINVGRKAFFKVVDSALADGMSKGAVVQFINDNGGRIELRQLALLLKKLGLGRSDLVALMADAGIMAPEIARALHASCELCVGVDK